MMTYDPHTERFIERARKAPRLSAVEEVDCIHAWRQRRDQRARARISEANLRHVVFAALKHRNYGVPLADLIGEGTVGLMKALDRFDEAKAVRFATYAAYWIRAHVLLAVMSRWSLMSGAGALDTRVFFRLRRERARLTSGPSTDNVVAHLAASFGVKEKRMLEMLAQIDHRGMSLDTELDAAERVPDELSCAPAQAAAFEEREAWLQVEGAVERARPTLDSRETFILERRLMAEAEDELSLGEIGAHFGVSRERVRQLEVRTCAKLRDAAIAGAAGARAA